MSSQRRHVPVLYLKQSENARGAEKKKLYSSRKPFTAGGTQPQTLPEQQQSVDTAEVQQGSINKAAFLNKFAFKIGILQNFFLENKTCLTFVSVHQMESTVN